MFISTVDLRYLTLFSVALTLAEGHKVSQNLLASFSRTLSQQIGVKFDVVLKQLS